jgi:hypothetical protein
MGESERDGAGPTLTSEVYNQIRVEEQSMRNVNLPPLPAATTSPGDLGLACKKCGCTTTKTATVTFKDGTRHLRQRYLFSAAAGH